MTQQQFNAAVAAELACEPENIAHLDLDAAFASGIDPHRFAQQIISREQGV
jgi:hypothetical protein